MSTQHARNVILGAGAMGSSAAYHLAKRGEPVLLVEQFALGHNRGSSHGAARITRHSYADVRYAKLMPQAFRAWRELEADAGQSLFFRTGGVSICPAGVDYVEQVAASLQEIDVPHKRMTGRQLHQSFPAFQVADDAEVVFEPDAGMLAAAHILRALVALAREYGGAATQVVEHCPILGIDLDADKPTLVTTLGTITADRLIVTAGPWVSRLLPQLTMPLRPTRQQVFYFRPSRTHDFALGRFPVFIFKGPGELDSYYGMPPFEGLGVKVARHGGPEVDPNQVEPLIGEAYEEGVRAFLRGCLPEIADVLIDFSEVCLYTNAPKDEFLVGFFKHRPDVVLASPCSGHGFKFSCLIGSVLADLVTRGATDLETSFWTPPRD